MNRVITIGREFGSGGRELGKRLAELLQIAYYDKEIIEEIAKRTQLAESYVHQIVEQKTGVFYPITIGRTLHAHQVHNFGNDFMLKQYTTVYSEQANVLREMAEKSDCVIVGRCADYILKEHNPLRLFVYADMDSKVARCRLKGDAHEELSDKDLRKKIRRVDKNRAKYYQYYTGHTWGNRSNYDLCVNTSAISVKECAEMLAEMLKNR
ncbi:MAG: cytidylate kinase-like family protein [Clostridia bacterium]|nr:cytidylate kinase-like family protein [Clostridia bacterium]